MAPLESRPGAAAKRAFDIIVAAGGLVLLAPVMALVALAVRSSVGSPVLFRQTRPGRWSRPFQMYKFRTMTAGRGADGRLLPDEYRLTRTGRFLRSTSLDELPTLVNVVRGDMSLVGPRPLLMEYLALYTSEQRRRHEVRPGVTGWAQVNGRNALDWEEQLRMDVWYVDHRSFRLDLIILLRTLKSVLKREGITQRGRDTREKFRGTSER